jgi:LmbE family N-acetylglucosaminyl deacetylase
VTISLDRLVHEPEAFKGLPIVAVVAHPDDEVLGCGILLSRHPKARIVHVTDGAPRNGEDAARLGFASIGAYAKARRAELEAAMALAGLDPSQLVALDLPDQGAAAGMASVARRLMPLLRGAAVVLTHAYEGGHPDHDATAYAVHRAAARLDEPRPLLVEMPFYRASPDDWLRQDFEPLQGAGPEVRLDLSADERHLKQRMYDAHASQAGVLAGFPIGAERFRVAPDYDFGALPNGGLMLYERYGWGLTGADWLDRVAEAEAALAAAP